MPNDRTTEEPQVQNHPRCFKCERYLKCAIKTDSASDYWEFPQGLVLGGGGNFGSCHYDSMIDGIGVDVVICDDCLVKYKDLLREVNRGESLYGDFSELQNQEPKDNP